MKQRRVKILAGKDKGKFGKIQKRLSDYKSRIVTDDGFRTILWNDEFRIVEQEK